MKNLDKLLSVINTEIADSPLSHLGMKWCGLSQTEIAERIGITRETVARTLRTEQILSFVCVIDGTRRTLLRPNDGKTTAEFRAVRDQRLMKAEFLGHTTATTVPPKAYGLLRELCLSWPEKDRLAIFRYALRNWRVFMGCYRFDASCYPEKYPHHKPGRFYKHPNIFALTDGREIARQIYRDRGNYS